MEQRGFTLLEVIIVILIISVLTTLGIPTFQGAIIKSKLTGMLQGVSQIERAIDSWLLEHEWGVTLPLLTEEGYDVPTSRGDFHYGHGTSWNMSGEAMYMVQVFNFPGGVETKLCERRIYKNSRVWYVYPFHPWGKFLRDILPKESITDEWDYF